MEYGMKYVFLFSGQGAQFKGMLQDVAKVISEKLNVNIRKITISSDQGIFDGIIEVKVHDRDEVKIIMENLKNIKDLQGIQQI